MYNKLTPDVGNYLGSKAQARTEWKPSSNDKESVQPTMFVLFEHAAGFSIFSVAEFEEIGVFLPQVEESVADVSKFKSIIKLVGFTPFKTAVAALENMNAISEGIPSEDLQVFLDNTIPKKKKCTVGVADPKLGAGINEVMGIQCIHTGVVPEIMRGIRMHFHNLVKGFTDVSAGVAQLGLGHAYSRTKVKFNVNRVDNMIIQSIALLDQLDKDVNTFAMRIREWYSYHFPELVKIVPENYTYAKVVKFIKNRKELTDDKLSDLEEIVMDSSKAQAIIDASKSSMGMDINVIDLMNIEMFASRVIALADYRKQLANYLGSKMDAVAPNLCTLVGEQVGARLISHAGSLTNLAKYPASTIQILGAEKALFRALKTRGNTPKYGLLYHSTFIGRAGLKNKGRISRYLANKCSLASRIDCFSEMPTSVFGQHLRQQVEDRLKFYESGETPKTNLEVMKEAMEENEEAVKLKQKAEKKKNKKLKKQKESVENGENNLTLNSTMDESEIQNGDVKVKKSKKKRKHEELDESASTSVSKVEDTVEPPKKKKKKNKQHNAE